MSPGTPRPFLSGYVLARCPATGPGPLPRSTSSNGGLEKAKLADETLQVDAGRRSRPALGETASSARSSGITQSVDGRYPTACARQATSPPPLQEVGGRKGSPKD